MPRVAPGATPVQFYPKDGQEDAQFQAAVGGSGTHQLFVIRSKNARDMGAVSSAVYNSKVSVSFFDFMSRGA